MDSETNGPSQSVEAGLTSAFQRAQGNLREQYESCEESVRQSPGSSLLMAAIAGYIFRSVPVGALLGGLIRLVLALLRPALFFYAAAKGYELLKQSGTQEAEEAKAPRRAPRVTRG